MEPFNADALTRSLTQLSREGQLAFGLSSCERLYPNYVAFERESSWGDHLAVRTALDLAWAVLEATRATPESIALAREQVHAAEPETEDFQTRLTSSALDAAVSAALILQFLEEDAVERIVEIASLCRDTVDMFVQQMEGLVPSDPKRESRILNHHLMQAELKRQHDDLEMLQTFSARPAEVAQLRERWRNPKTSNIGQANFFDAST